MDISELYGLGYSSLDWEYAKRKSKDPDVKFEDILREKMKELEAKNETISAPNQVVRVDQRL